jgi:tRNA threonylcarbamoyladenosine biosynthesis protein TsaB
MLAHRAVEAGREQAKILAPLTEEFLKEKNLKIADLDRLAICTGPGSFTGLRIGLAFARGLALAGQKPLLGFDHFACTQEAVKRLGKTQNQGLLIIRDSGRDELFAQMEQPFLATSIQLVEILNKNADVLFTGNGGEMISASAPHLAARHINLPREELVFSAARLAEKATPLPNTMPEPLYLREADVTYQRV